MTMSRHARPLALAAAAAASLAVGAGCSTPSPPPGAIVFAAPIFGSAALTALAIPPTVALPHGPTVTVVNRSDVSVKTRIWTARTDVSVPAGYADQQTADRLVFHVEPNQLYYLDAGRKGWVTGMNDALVWIRFEADPDDTQTRPEPVWIQFERPGPYKIEVAGTFDRSKPNAGLEFYPLEDTSLSPLPRSLWIEEHDGKYAIAD